MRKLGKKIALKLLDAVDWIYRNKPEGEMYTKEDLEMMAKSRELRKQLGRTG